MTVDTQKLRELVEKAIKRAYLLGQDYWRLADSESRSDNRRSNDVQDKFDALRSEAVSVAGAQVSILQDEIDRLRGAGEPSDAAIEALAKQYDCHHSMGFKGFARALLSRYAAPQASADARKLVADGWLEDHITANVKFTRGEMPGVYYCQGWRDAETHYKLAALAAQKPVEGDAPDQSALDALINVHQELVEDNPYCYFELAHTRQTGWMAWITDKPLYPAQEIANPDRKVIARGQGDSAEEACRNALAAITQQGKEGA